MRMVSMAEHLIRAAWLTLTMIGVKYAKAYLKARSVITLRKHLAVECSRWHHSGHEHEGTEACQQLIAGHLCSGGEMHLQGPELQV
jgi:hypothetical protein